MTHWWSNACRVGSAAGFAADALESRYLAILLEHRHLAQHGAVSAAL